MFKTDVRVHNIKELSLQGHSRQIVILGNGPSLQNMDLTQLQKPILIGLNGSILYTKEKELKDDYYILSDLRFVKDPLKMKMLIDHLPLETKLIIRKELLDYIPKELKQKIYVVRSLGRDGFSSDLSKGFYFGCTTVMLGLQLANYLGGTKILLCGVDLRYDPEKPRFYKEGKVHSVDNFSCVQIHNIRNSYKLLKAKNTELLNCSFNSLLQPYLPYYELRTV